MTYVEFFSSEPLNNVCSSLTKKPDKVVFIGGSTYQMRAFIDRCSELFGDRVKFDCRKVNLYSLSSIVEALSGIVESEEECSVDLTGGPDLALVAMGIVAERHRDKHIQMHRVDIEDGQVTDCDEDGCALVPEKVALTADQLLRLHGGSIAKDLTEAAWDLSEDLLGAARTLWEHVSPAPADWNTLVTLLDRIFMLRDPAQSTDRMAVTPFSALTREELDGLDEHRDELGNFLESLREEGLVERFSLRQPAVMAEFRDRQIRRVMDKAGTILELRTYIAAKKAADREGNPVYSDCVGGAVIDWAGNDLADHTDPVNEIDLILMRGMQPVFISCKNGNFTAEELFKFKTVADRFGGKYAKKVLVSAYPVNNGDLRFRADELDIFLLDGVMYMKDHAFGSAVADLYEK